MLHDREAAMNAVYSGACDVVLAYHSVYREPDVSRARRPTTRSGAWASAVAGDDGFRRARPESIAGAVGYTAWASRYLLRVSRRRRETFGYVAINDRSNAARNPRRAHARPAHDGRLPRAADDPLAAVPARHGRPVDGADAFVITTTERARDLAPQPVLIHACTPGMIDQNEEDQTPSLRDARPARRGRVR